MWKSGGLRRAGLLAAAIIGLAGAPLCATAAPAQSGADGGDTGSRGRHGRHQYSSRRSSSHQAATRYFAKSKWSRASRRGYYAAKQATPPAPAPPVAPAPVSLQATSLAGQALVPVAAGGITSTSARMASDLAAVLDSSGLRVLPLMTRSSLPDALALAQADKADLVFLHSDLRAILSDAERSTFASRISYIARLYNEEVHIITGREFSSVRDLAGKKVNVGPEGSANAQTAELIFDRLGVTPYLVHIDQPTALAQLAAGEIAADVLVSGRPVKALQEFAGDGRFKLLPIPYEAPLQDVYLPAKIDSVDYGNLIPPGGSIDTLAVAIVLATVDAGPGTPRAARVARFTQALFDRFDALRDPSRHPKWRDVNLAAGVAGWSRFAAAQEAIDRTTSRSVSVAPETDPGRAKAASDVDQRFSGEPLQWRREKSQ